VYSDLEMKRLAQHPNCDICHKPLTPRSLITRWDLGKAWHIRCYNRTCVVCGKRVVPKDRLVAAHRPFHRACFLRCINGDRAEKGLPPLTAEQYWGHLREFWSPGGTAARTLAEHFPPPEKGE
jgi:hypothetical protein